MTTRKRKPAPYYSPQWFSETLATCQATIPPPLGVGLLVWECVVPSEWCPPGNARDSIHWSKAHRLKKRLRATMLRFALTRRSPLPGRPIVHCTRLTPHRTDPRSNWDKFPVDMLRPYKRSTQGESGALGLIVDDSGDHIDLRAEWVSSKLRCVYVRVFADPRFSHAESRRSDRPATNYCPVCAEMARDTSLSALDAVRIVQCARVP